jgi:hypothetical protein
MDLLWATVVRTFDKDAQNMSFRGSKSRNKVSVCEPADGSLSKLGFCLGLSEFGTWYEKLALVLGGTRTCRSKAVTRLERDKNRW